MYTAQDVMTRDVLACRDTATVEAAIQLLLDRRVSGAPVVNAAGDLVGVISEYQLLEIIYTPDLRYAPVSEFMTTEVLTVQENTLLSDVAGMFVAHRIRRLPVLRHGRLAGIIARTDILRYALESSAEVQEYLGEVATLSR